MPTDKAIAKDRTGKVVLVITPQGVTSPLPELEWIHPYCPNLTPFTHEGFHGFVARVAMSLKMEQLDYEISATVPEPVPEGYEVW